jgi:hypothetical protein
MLGHTDRIKREREGNAHPLAERHVGSDAPDQSDKTGRRKIRLREFFCSANPGHYRGVFVGIHRTHLGQHQGDARKPKVRFGLSAGRPIPARSVAYAVRRSGLTLSPASPGSQCRAHASMSVRRFSRASERL